MVDEPVLDKGGLDIALAPDGRKDRVVNDGALRTIDEVHRTRRLVRRRRCRRRASDYSNEVRVEVLVQRRAITEHLSKRSDGIRRAREDRVDVLARRERE